MASGCKGTSRPGANTDTDLYVCSGSACVVNVSACNDHASNADPIEIYVVPNGGSVSANHLVYSQLTIKARDTYILDTEKMILETGAKVYIAAPDSAAQFNATISTIGL